MAITPDDFKKIWASTSSVPEYTFSDSDYQDGWEFVGNLPPTRAMWDTLQRRNDQKMKYLQDNGSMCFDSVADMVASNLESGQTVITKGYYSVNDGGSALYTIRSKDVADVDDGGSIIFLDNGNVAELIPDEIVNVRQFGAKGDGVTDDTSAFRNVLAYSVGKTLTVPQGSYSIDSALFADGVIDVWDDGTYPNVKPVYKQESALNGWDNIQYLKSYDRNVISATSYPQGFCYCSKLDKFIVAEVASDNSAQRLYLINPSTRDIDTYYDYTDLGHCNSLCYCNETDKIYAVTMNDSGINKEVAIIDPDTMTVEGTMTLPYGASTLKYDPVCKVFVTFQNPGATRGLEVYDLNFNRLKSYVINFGTPTTGNSGLAYDGQVLMFGYSYIGCTDELGNINHILPTFGNLIEWEDADYYNGDYYLTASIDTGILLCRANRHRHERSVVYDMYLPTETLTSTILTAGFITSGAKGVRFSVPLNKTFTATHCSIAGTIKLRQNGQYPGNSSAGVDIATLFDSSRICQLRGNGIVNILLDSSAALANATNNDVVGVEMEYTLTFAE